MHGPIFHIFVSTAELGARARRLGYFPEKWVRFSEQEMLQFQNLVPI
jgi:hypothetical protein